MSNNSDKVPFNTNAAIAAVNIKKFAISDVNGNVVDLTGSLSEFYFYESVLSNYVSATIEIVDSGYVLTADGKLTAKPGGIMGNGPVKGAKYPTITSGNRVDFDIEDNNYNNRVDTDGLGRSLNNLKMLNGMYVSRIRDASTSSKKNYYAIDLVSEEALNNELTRVSKRYDGKISEHIKEIVEKVLRVDKGLIEVEETALTYNFIGNDSKPFNVCTKLANKAVPLPFSDRQTINRRAGYLFFQTRLGMHFISIANRYYGKGDKKRATGKIENIINTSEGKKYTFRVKEFISTSAKSAGESEDLILKYTVNTTVDAQKDLALGSYASRSIFFDFYSMDYRVRDFNIINDIFDRDQKTMNQVLNLFNARLPVPQLRGLPSTGMTVSPSRLFSHILDVGTLPSGVNSEQELENWKNDPTSPNNDADKNMVQSIMQYNNLFREKVNIVIAGDFSMIPGNVIRCTFEAIGTGGGTIGNPSEADSNLSGVYMIGNVCHRVTPRETFTSMDLVPVSRII
jgi:hypothetical protein